MPAAPSPPRSHAHACGRIAAHAARMMRDRAGSWPCLAGVLRHRDGQRKARRGSIFLAAYLRVQRGACGCAGAQRCPAEHAACSCPARSLLWREIESAPNPLWSFGAGGWFQLVWGKEWYHRDVLWPGDSAYVRAMVSWRLDTMTTEVGVPELIFVRTPGKLDSAVLNEYASFAPEGRARASFENSRWY